MVKPVDRDEVRARVRAVARSSLPSRAGDLMHANALAVRALHGDFA
jgi:DNA-binding response OmpR family regulator